MVHQFVRLERSTIEVGAALPTRRLVGGSAKIFAMITLLVRAGHERNDGYGFAHLQQEFLFPTYSFLLRAGGPVYPRRPSERQQPLQGGDRRALRCARAHAGRGKLLRQGQAGRRR